MIRIGLALAGGVIAVGLILTSENALLELLSVVGIAAAARWGIGK